MKVLIKKIFLKSMNDYGLNPFIGAFGGSHCVEK